MTDQSLVPTTDNIGTIIMPSPDMARNMMDSLQGIMQAVLDDSDYAVISGKKHRKRSGFTKLRRAFNISVQELDGAWEDLDNGEFGYRVMVRASFPDGRYEDGDGYCDSIEMHSGRIAASRHNVRAKAVTRAKNRATADLLGTGEVSAEELGPDAYRQRAPRQRQPQRPPTKPPAPKTNGNRPLDAAKIRTVCRRKAQWFEEIESSGEFRRNGAMEPITDGQVKALPGLMTKALSGMSAESAEKARYDIMDYLFTVRSTSDLTKAEASAIIDWLKVPEDGDWGVNQYAEVESARILQAVAVEAGQVEMEL